MGSGARGCEWAGGVGGGGISGISSAVTGEISGSCVWAGLFAGVLVSSRGGQVGMGIVCLLGEGLAEVRFEVAVFAEEGDGFVVGGGGADG